MSEQKKVYRKVEVPVVIPRDWTQKEVEVPAVSPTIVGVTETHYVPRVDAQSEGGKAKAANNPWPREKIRIEFRRCWADMGKLPSYNAFCDWLSITIEPPCKTSYYEHTKDLRK